MRRVFTIKNRDEEVNQPDLVLIGPDENQTIQLREAATPAESGTKWAYKENTILFSDSPEFAEIKFILMPSDEKNGGHFFTKDHHLIYFLDIEQIELDSSSTIDADTLKNNTELRAAATQFVSANKTLCGAPEFDWDGDEFTELPPIADQNNDKIESLTQLMAYADSVKERVGKLYFWNGRDKSKLIQEAQDKINEMKLEFNGDKSKQTLENSYCQLARESGLIDALKFHRFKYKQNSDKETSAITTLKESSFENMTCNF